MNCNLSSKMLDTLTDFLVHPTSPVLLTKIGPLRALYYSPLSIKKREAFTYLKFENK